MPACKNKGCTGHARRGQFFCYDCYQAWVHGGDDAVAARIAEMNKGEAELAELRQFRARVFEAVIPAFGGKVPAVQHTEDELFATIHSGHYVLRKLRREWYSSPEFKHQNVPKHGAGVRMRRAVLLTEWVQGQLDKANKPGVAVTPDWRTAGTVDCQDCGTACWLHPLKGCPAEALAAAREEYYRRYPTAAETIARMQVAAAAISSVGQRRMVYPVSKHPSAKTVDEAEPLRRKVAELEGKLLVAQQSLVGHLSGGFVKILATVCLLAGVGFGILIK